MASRWVRNHAGMRRRCQTKWEALRMTETVSRRCKPRACRYPITRPTANAATSPMMMLIEPCRSPAMRYSSTNARMSAGASSPGTISATPASTTNAIPGPVPFSRRPTPVHNLTPRRAFDPSSASASPPQAARRSSSLICRRPRIGSTATQPLRVRDSSTRACEWPHRTIAGRAIESSTSGLPDRISARTP